jgi:hypothetical protein
MGAPINSIEVPKAGETPDGTGRVTRASEWREEVRLTIVWVFNMALALSEFDGCGYRWR